MQRKFSTLRAATQRKSFRRELLGTHREVAGDRRVSFCLAHDVTIRGKVERVVLFEFRLRRTKCRMLNVNGRTAASEAMNLKKSGNMIWHY